MCISSAGAVRVTRHPDRRGARPPDSCPLFPCAPSAAHRRTTSIAICCPGQPAQAGSGTRAASSLEQCGLQQHLQHTAIHWCRIGLRIPCSAERSLLYPCVACSIRRSSANQAAAPQTRAGAKGRPQLCRLTCDAMRFRMARLCCCCWHSSCMGAQPACGPTLTTLWTYTLSMEAPTASSGPHTPTDRMAHRARIRKWWRGA